MSFVHYGKSIIEYSLEFCERKDLKINVYPDLRVEVLAPLNASASKISEKVRKRAKWISKQKRFFEQFHPLQPPRRFIAGETHRYLGKQ